VSGLQAIAIAGWISVRAAGYSYSRLDKCPGCRL